VSRAARVVFIDATADAAAGIQLRELTPAETGQVMAHAADPRSVLALARDVFGHSPAAWWLTIPVEKFEFGDELSPLARRGVELASERIQALARNVADV
ncbi:MAG: hypothetical protein ABSA69_03070, partial [Verrucomicrobiota bacterium]